MIAVLCATAIIAISIRYFLTNPTPTEQFANVVPSPSNQIVVVSLNQTPSFKLTFSQNGQNFAFTCTTSIRASSISVSGYALYPSYIHPSHYGRYTFDVLIPDPSQAQTVTYYEVVHNSNGNRIASNRVTVENK